MPKQIYFICGLPRSGSTLLANMLAQDPNIHTTPTSGCHDVMFGVKNHWAKLTEHKAAKSLADPKNLQRVLWGILHDYHDTDRPIIIDKGRGWISLLEMLEFALGHQAKILVPVRCIAQIFSSFEKIHRRQVTIGEHNGDYMKGQTIEGRIDDWMRLESPFGLAYNRLKDAMHKRYGNRLHFVDFDALTKFPTNTMKKVYKFLDIEKKIDWDWTNVEQYTHEDDSVHGSVDLHTIRRVVERVPTDASSVLGTALAKKWSDPGLEFWRTPQSSANYTKWT